MAPQTDRHRRERYQRLFAVLCQRTTFSIADIKAACGEDPPAFVTRTLNQLAREGILAADGNGSGGMLRWRDASSTFSADSWIERQVRGVQMTQTPAHERPRERLFSVGVDALRTAELLAILIRTGRRGESALQAGEKIANRFADEMERLPDQGWSELREVSPVVSEAVYCQIMAGIELGRRVVEASLAHLRWDSKIDSSRAAIEYCRQAFARLAQDRCQEEFHIVTLDTKHHPMRTHRITVGTLNASLVHPREVFRPAIRDAAAAVLLVHNHPSGDPTPSPEDKQVTRMLKEAGELIGITVLDAIIVAGKDTVSIVEHEHRFG